MCPAGIQKHNCGAACVTLRPVAGQRKGRMLSNQIAAEKQRMEISPGNVCTSAHNAPSSNCSFHALANQAAPGGKGGSCIHNHTVCNLNGIRCYCSLHHSVQVTIQSFCWDGRKTCSEASSCWLVSHSPESPHIPGTNCMLVFDPALKTAACDLCPGRGVLYLNAMIKSSQTILAISQTRSHMQRGRVST